MNFTNIRLALNELLLTRALKALTVDNIQAILKRAVEIVKEKAAETKTPLDDLAVAAVEYVVSDRDRVAVLVNYLKALANGETQAKVPGCDTETSLAVEICSVKEEYAEAALSVSTIVALVKVILPLLIDWWQNRDTETETETETE